MGRLGALWILVAWGAQAGTGLEVSLSVAPEAPCITLESLSAQIEREGLTITGSGALDVDVSASAPGVRLRARRQDDGRLLVRAIPAREGKCEGVERALVMLIREWARAPQLIPSVERPRPMKSAPDAGVVSEVVPVRRSSVVELPAPGLNEADAGSAPAEPVEPVSEPDAGVEEPRQVITSVVELPAAPSPIVPWQVRLAAGAGVAGASTAFVVPAGSLVLDVGREAWGGSLDATIEGTALLVGAPGQVSVAFQWLTLSARWRLNVPDRLSVDFGLGVRGSRLTAAASGFTTNGSITLYSVGPAATATLWIRLIGPLQLMLRASAALRLPAESLVVVEGGPTFSITVGQLGAVAGLGVAWP